MPTRKHLINVHTGTGTTAPTGTSLKLGEIAVQHTTNNPALWIKVGTSSASNVYEKFIGETEINSLVSAATSGLSAATMELSAVVIDNELVVATAINGLNADVQTVSSLTIELSGAIQDVDMVFVPGTGVGSAVLKGGNNTAGGAYSVAEGSGTTASGSFSHAEGKKTLANGIASHAEGENTIASGASSHAEGSNTAASGNSSHAEGTYTTASGASSHAEGNRTGAGGTSSHAEGYHTIARGDYSHAEGYETETNNECEYAGGKWNYSHTGGPSSSGHTIHSIGIGSGSGESFKKNAVEVMRNGDVYIYGLGGYTGGTIGGNVKTLQATIGDIETLLAAI